MKKKSKKQLEYEPILANKRHQKNLNRLSATYRPNKEFHSKYLYHGKMITAPEFISIYDIDDSDYNFYNETIKFINSIKNNFGKEKCVIDFRNTRIVSAAAMIIVYAAFDNAKSKGEKKSTILWAASSPSVNRNIKNTNLQKLIERKDISYNFNSRSDLPIISGHGSMHMEDIIDYIQRRVYDNKMSPETEYAYGDAVSETINNVNLHAYPDRKTEKRQWWLMCNLIGDQLYLAIYDTGVGIPKTIVDKPWFFSSLKSVYPKEYDELQKAFPETKRRGIEFLVFQKLSDAKLVFLSMQGDVSGTKKSKHGQGSKSIRKLVSENNDGKLWVFSNKGLYTIEKGGSESDIYALPKRLPGTLVQWNIKVA